MILTYCNYNDNIENEVGVTITEISESEYYYLAGNGKSVLIDRVIANDKEEKSKYEETCQERIENIELETIEYIYKRIDKVDEYPDNRSFKAKITAVVVIAKHNGSEEIVYVSNECVSSVGVSGLYEFKWNELSKNIELSSEDYSNEKYPINVARVSVMGYFETLVDEDIESINGFYAEGDEKKNLIRFTSKDVFYLIINYDSKQGLSNEV